jgi:glycerol dehydrogenase
MRYYQGPGTTQSVTPEIVSALGERAFIFGGPSALKALEKHRLFEALEEKGVNYTVEEFGKSQVWGNECCDEEVGRLAKIATNNDCDVVIGVGGGKAIDAGKAVSNEMNLPMVSFPTVASTDAPTSSLSVMYTAEHQFKEYRFYDRSPDAIVVDTKIVSEAPARYLACGIGDAFSKRFEVDACYSSGHNNQIAKPLGGFSPLTSMNLAFFLHDLLKTWGRKAMLSAKHNVVSAALEAVVEGNVLLSGLAFESGGLAAAHSIYNGLSALEEKMRPHQYHGELVHFGTCVQVVLDDQPRDVVYDVLRFGHEIGLPETLGEIGLADATDEDLWRVAEKATAEGETIHKMSMKATPEKVVHAIRATDKIGQKISKEITRASYD